MSLLAPSNDTLSSPLLDEDDKAPKKKSNSKRLHGLDFTRGAACLSMPIYHSIYNLYVVGLVDTQWARHIFWQIYQVLGLGTFVLVSGMAFTLSTAKGVNWQRLTRRALKLALIAMAITLVTFLVMPDRYVRFGVIHFFATCIMMAPLFKPMKGWAILPGLLVVAVGVYVTKAGISPDPLLYVTGLMSDRPKAMDYIPLIPWFGVFLVGMGAAYLLPSPKHNNPPRRYMRPVIWLGKHSLWFYLVHQLIVFGILWTVAQFVY